VIPADLRKKYNLKPGKEVVFVDYGGVLAIVPALESPILQAAGLLKGGGQSLTQTLLAEHQKEQERE
jgi:bifunctional DNA-binding transcriptional regulator/antitoxin component of YhaV-PrlF toxin-antitoxin module